MKIAFTLDHAQGVLQDLRAANKEGLTTQEELGLLIALRHAEQLHGTLCLLATLDRARLN